MGSASTGACENSEGWGAGLESRVRREVKGARQGVAARARLFVQLHADSTQCGSGTAACFVRTPSAVRVCMCIRCVRDAIVFECGAYVSLSPQALGAEWHHQQQYYHPLFSIILRSDVMHFFILSNASNLKKVFNINLVCAISNMETYTWASTSTSSFS